MRKNTKGRARPLIAPLVEAAHELRRRFDAGWPARAAEQLESSRAQYQSAIARPVDGSEICDQLAQTIVCLHQAYLQFPALQRSAQLRKWLIEQAHPLWRDALRAVLQVHCEGNGRLWDISLGELLPSADKRASIAAAAPHAPILLFEQFLGEYRSKERRRYGVFFTPLPIVRAMLSHIDQFLTDEFPEASSRGLDRLAADTSSVWLVDPAAGCGTFLSETIRLVHGQRNAFEAKTSAADWTPLLRRMMPRLIGYDILLPACALAQLMIAAVLADTGFDFQSKLPLNVVPHNFLAGPPPGPVAAEQRRSVIVVGNPPFSGISSNQQPWIEHLLRGAGSDAAARRSYFRVDGRPLGERKVWLNDDYVKFFRSAQWLVESAESGLVAFVSNHAYIDNATFRGMRASLCETFPQITILDLHGNLKRREQTPAGGFDENVFGIEQGIAISYFRRPPIISGRSIVKGDLWGTAALKLTELQQRQLPGQPIPSESPHYLFTQPARASSARPAGMPLDEIMPVHCTAPITARDHFIVALVEDELVRRLSDFADLTIDDSVIRARYFRRTRSAHYAAGDTRGWKLSEARKRLAACEQPFQSIRKCWYRPFDERVVMWTDWMIDWPRPQLLRQAELPGNWFLVTRRQMLPDSPANFFWVSDQLALDGIIRSDNRGSETLLPVYVNDEGQRRANFADPFIREFLQRYQLSWQSLGQGDLSTTAGPEDLADYIYANFWSSQYRQAYAGQLCLGFPPIILPPTRELLQRMVQLGRELRECHVLKPPTAQQPRGRFFCEPASSTEIASGYPRFSGETIWINGGAAFGKVPEPVWKFRVGTHQVCRKWLVERRRRTLKATDIAHFESLLAAVAQTISLVRQLDMAIEGAGTINAFS